MLWWEEKFQKDKNHIDQLCNGGYRDKFRGIIGLEPLAKKIEEKVEKNESK